MTCPNCGAEAARRYCSWCGQPLPELVGVDYPYGVRFRAGGGRAERMARGAPVFRERGGWREARYDRSRIRQLVALVQALDGDEVQHTVDGEDWSDERVPWSCFASALEGWPGGWRRPHPGMKCDSVWGCRQVRERQDPYLDGQGEIFWHGRHGHFFLPPEQERWIPSYTRPEAFRGWLETARWGFDRKVIRAELMHLVRSRAGHRCPLFAVSYLDQQIRRLPEVVIAAVRPEKWEVVIEPGTKVGLLWRCYDQVIDVQGEHKSLPAIGRVERTIHDVGAG